MAFLARSTRDAGTCGARVRSLRAGPRRVALAALAAAAAGCFALGVQGNEEARRFSHAVHAGDLGMACDACHLSSADGRTYGRAGHAQCVACHADGQIDRESLATPRPYRAVFDDEVRFAHRSHAAFRCDACHGDLAGAQRLPTMESCLGCHAAEAPVGPARPGAGPPGGCATCHATIRQDVAPPGHQGLFRTRHGRDARAEEATCRRCHRDDACTECHRTQRPDDHTPRFERAAHGLAALRDRDRCATCHEADQCASCHRQEPPSHSLAFTMRVPAAADATLHARDARRRPGACLACHDFEATCRKCHG